MLDGAADSFGISSDDVTVISQSPQETYHFGKLLGENLRPGDLVALCGELGAGKTCLTQGIARGLGVPAEYPVTSPTFTIINEYPGRLTLYHLDLYRLSGPQDLDEIGYDDCFTDSGVMVMEWAEKIKEILPERAIFITITYIDEERRKMVVSPNSEKIAHLCKEWGHHTNKKWEVGCECR